MEFRRLYTRWVLQVRPEAGYCAPVRFHVVWPRVVRDKRTLQSRRQDISMQIKAEFARNHDPHCKSCECGTVRIASIHLAKSTGGHALAIWT